MTKVWGWRCGLCAVGSAVGSSTPKHTLVFVLADGSARCSALSASQGLGSDVPRGLLLKEEHTASVWDHPAASCHRESCARPQSQQCCEVGGRGQPRVLQVSPCKRSMVVLVFLSTEQSSIFIFLPLPNSSAAAPLLLPAQLYECLYSVSLSRNLSCLRS